MLLDFKVKSVQKVIIRCFLVCVDIDVERKHHKKNLRTRRRNENQSKKRKRVLRPSTNEDARIPIGGCDLIGRIKDEFVFSFFALTFFTSSSMNFIYILKIFISH